MVKKIIIKYLITYNLQNQAYFVDYINIPSSKEIYKNQIQNVQEFFTGI